MAKTKRKRPRPSQRICKHLIKRPKGRCSFKAGPSGYCSRHVKLHFPNGYPPPELIEPEPAPNAEAARADFYRSCYTKAELEGVNLEDFAAKQMDAEIRLLRVQLKRVAEQIKQESEDPNFSLLRPHTTEQEIDDVDVELDAEGRPVPVAQPRRRRGQAADAAEARRRGTLKRRTTQVAPDLYVRQDRLMGRLAQYIKIRDEMETGSGGGVSPDEKAQMIRQMWDEVGGVMHGKNLKEV